MKVSWSLGFLGAGLLIVLGNLGTSEAKVLPVRIADDPDHLQMMRLIRLEEKRETISYRNSSGTRQNSDKHVLGLVFKSVGDGVATSGGQTGGLPGGTSSTGSTGSTGSTTAISTGGMGQMMMMEPPTPPGPTTTGSTGTTGATTATTGATTGTTTGTTGGGPQTYTGYYFYVSSPGEMAPIGSRLPTVYEYDSDIPQLPSGLRIQFYPGEEVVVHLASDAALSSGSLTVTVETYVLVHYPDNPETPENEEHWDSLSAFNKVEYDITKYLCQDSSIDTRKAFGTPNREGELPDDPNALPATLNFGGSVWRGGTFVGNMPWQTRDQSGLARAQIYPQGTEEREGPPRMVGLSMFYRGTAPNVTNSVTIGAYTPSDSDTNFEVGSNAVTWDSRWDIQPRTSPGDPRDPTKDPIFRVPFTSTTPAGEYATWTLTDTAATTSYTPATILTAIALAIENETEVVTNSYSAWRYFASDHFPSEVANTFPNNDSMPRLWVVDFVDDDNWVVDWEGGWWFPL